MKIKNDFVTNSSSTSFIITIESDKSERQQLLNELNERFEELCGRDVQDGQSDQPPSFDINSLRQISDNMFALEGVVPYFSGYDDLPKHIRDLVLDHVNNPEGLNKHGIKTLDFKIIDNNTGSK